MAGVLGGCGSLKDGDTVEYVCCPRPDPPNCGVCCPRTAGVCGRLFRFLRYIIVLICSVYSAYAVSPYSLSGLYN